jgi:hypothetical protein
MNENAYPEIKEDLKKYVFICRLALCEFKQELATFLSMNLS